MTKLPFEIKTGPEGALVRAVVAELCICKFFNVPFAHDPKNPHNPFDLILPSRRKAIVKSCKTRGDGFAIPENHGFQFHT